MLDGIAHHVFDGAPGQVRRAAHVDDCNARHGDIAAALFGFKAVRGSTALRRDDVLQAPPHGRGTSSTPAVLGAVHPLIAVFQVGYCNLYHHRKAEVFERYGQLQITRIRTDESGGARSIFGDMAVTLFDVGQGMALLIETSGHRLLYDTGPAYSPESNGANRVILPYLKGRGIDRLDTVVVSHSDIDHVGGALDVLDGVAVGGLLSSLPDRHPAVLKAAHHTRCTEGRSWTWDGVRFEVLHPSPASYDDASLKPNARSCTLRITAKAGVILLAGDIEARWRCFKSGFATATAIRRPKCSSATAGAESNASVPIRAAPCPCCFTATCRCALTATITRAIESVINFVCRAYHVSNSQDDVCHARKRTTAQLTPICQKSRQTCSTSLSPGR